MKLLQEQHLDTWFVWLSFTFLALAILFGIFAGGAIGMYYDLIPDAGAREDRLTVIQFYLFLAAVLFGVLYGLVSVGNAGYGSWGQKARRFLPFIAPFVIFLATEGLVSHFLWWEAISYTDRFHMLHHSLVVGLPLIGLYWLALRRWWRPENGRPAAVPPPSRLFIGGLAILVLLVALLMGVPELGLMLIVAVLLIALLVTVARRRLGSGDTR